ncbi:7-cyano-7-deazaguanine synthase QueC [Methanimicrococcus blatticola]|uniref:7-cyano-7-deazaguanine synthase n=1 Tax=Methanimicrococcus blatticola TaxID=91560 RepID=A0A484F4V1_9EURY|nr:7-cyano-7-deazaguanine synthase QueC [Methanimicrococcus blatticola]MBZ3935644.1 7-cyano-7-deazaguanine synthase QueC [Methanimicrococcus blatticola]MCC2509286.1 7-cyano-7-deazaguanine synthase QueC [Methanimicrococcus blatticola]TDQ69350.1 7-cyano-7-deazaguanine synthase [Methanimicrococcus blatticola]
METKNYPNQIEEVAADGAVVVFSGGQDSTTCLFWAEKIYGKENIIPVSFFYGQKHQKELEAAEKITKTYGFKGMNLSLDFLKSISACALTEEEIEVDKEIPEGEDYPNTFVPGRNLFFLSIAGVIARNNGWHNVITGVSESDFSGYPDCREEFIRSAEKTITLAMDYEIKIHTPLMHKTKAQTWKMAEELGVFDLVAEETVTCYNGIIGSGCGECPACALRQKGLEEYRNGIY